MIKKVMLIFVAVMLFGFVGKAQNVPDIEGVWTRTGDHLAITIQQNGSNATITLTTTGWDHFGKVKYKGNDIFKGTMKRTTRSNGCVTNISQKIEVLTENQI
jgi:hypothetical protein